MKKAMIADAGTDLGLVDDHMFSNIGEKMKSSSIHLPTCPSCRSGHIAHLNSDIICGDCGTSMGEMLDHRAEWSQDTNHESQGRCNITQNHLLPESTLGAGVILGKYASKQSYDIKNTMVFNSVPATERAMKVKMENIDYICREYDIPDIIIRYAREQYFELNQILTEKKFPHHRGNKNMGIQAAAVIRAFEHAGKPRTYREIANLFRIEPKFVNLGIDLFNQYLPETSTDKKATNHFNYIWDLGESLGLTPEVRYRAIHVAKMAEELGILENNATTSLVAGCIYYVIVERALPITPLDISNNCSISCPTIDKVSQKLFQRSVDLASGICV